MKLQKILAMVGVLVISAVFLAGCQFNTGRGVGAASTLIKGETMSDAELMEVTKKFVEYSDKQNTIAKPNSAYAKRLAKLTNGLTTEDGLALNFKVYMVLDVNAWAAADGSIRVYSGLMDLMTDDELFFVIGHEIGHVKHGHSAEAMRHAYRVSAAVQAAGATHSAAAAITDSELGDLAEKFLNAQFSQAQESESDKYGYGLVKKYNRSTAAAVSGLRKLGNAGGGALSSHPNPQDRANTIEKMS